MNGLPDKARRTTSTHGDFRMGAMQALLLSNGGATGCYRLFCGKSGP
jgi:hypothetical protein